MPTAPQRITTEAWQDKDVGAHHASVEATTPTGRGSESGSAYYAGPFSTQFRAHVAAESLGSRVAQGGGERHRISPIYRKS